MKPLFLFLALAVAAPARAQSVCYYNHREGIATKVYARCASGQLIFDSYANYTPSCGVTNAFNMFSAICKDPCAAALKGIKNLNRKGKNVLVGPALLPLEASSKFAFATTEESCSFERLKAKGIKLEPITDDDLIKAGAD